MAKTVKNRNSRLGRILTLLAGSTVLSFGLHVGAHAGLFGAVKPDLIEQYVSSFVPNATVRPADLAAYRYIRVKMAEKAIADAADAGLKFLRVGVSGYRPFDFGDKINELALWQTDPAQFWGRIDEMFNDLDANSMQVVPMLNWNLAQFPALGNDTVATFIRSPQSASRQLFARYISDFIRRYKNRKTILFYQLTTEQNLMSDVAVSQQCKQVIIGRRCVWDDFSSDDLIEFSREIVALVKSLDPNRLVSSGYSFPRPAAWHLRHHPQFGPAGPDWTPDTRQEAVANLVSVHEPYDVISVHIYPGNWSNRYGRPSGDMPTLVSDAADAARSAGKPLFIGEFGDTGGDTPFMRGMLDAIVRNRVDYAAVWVWEFYQNSTFETFNSKATRFNIEPGYSDSLIAQIKGTAARMANTAPTGSAPRAPRVVLTWPLPCTTIDNPIELSAVASDGAMGVRRVDFIVDGETIGSTAAPPYRVAFDPRPFGNKVVEISARAYSASGNSAQFAAAFRLGNTNSACSVNQP